MTLWRQQLFRDEVNGVCETEGWRCNCDYLIDGVASYPQLINFAWIDKADFEEEGDDCDVYKAQYPYSGWSNFTSIYEPDCNGLRSEWFFYGDTTGLALTAFFRDPLSYFTSDYIIGHATAPYSLLQDRAVSLSTDGQGYQCFINEDCDNGKITAIPPNSESELDILPLEVCQKGILEQNSTIGQSTVFGVINLFGQYVEGLEGGDQVQVNMFVSQDPDPKNAEFLWKGYRDVSPFSGSSQSTYAFYTELHSDYNNAIGADLIDISDLGLGIHYIFLQVDPCKI